MSQERGKERKKKKTPVNSSSRGARARLARGSGRRGGAAAGGGVPRRGFPVSQRTLVAALPLARSPRRSLRLPSSLKSAIYYFSRSIDNVWDSSNPGALVCNQRIYSHWGRRIRIKSPWPRLGYSVIFPGSSFKSTPHRLSVYYMLI